MSSSTTKIDQQFNITIVKELRDYSNDPLVKKKREEAIRFIEKHGIPEDFKQKNK